MLKQTLRLTTGIMLALPAVVSATPLFLEYDARINSCFYLCADNGYASGDRVSGWLKIDTDLAPPDLYAGEPQSQIRSIYAMRDGPDFINGIGFPGPALPRRDPFDVDQVHVIDDSDSRSHQSYALWDYSNDGKGGTTVFELQVSSDDRVDDFIHGKGIVQSFDSINFEGAVGFIGRLMHEVKGAAVYGFDLVFDRVSLTPGRCRAG